MCGLRLDAILLYRLSICKDLFRVSERSFLPHQIQKRSTPQEVDSRTQYRQRAQVVANRRGPWPGSGGRFPVKIMSVTAIEKFKLKRFEIKTR